MNLDLLVLLIAVLVGLYMAWNIGANDVANAFGTSIGSKALTFKQVVLIAAIFEFAGAVLVGSHVTDTVRKGIIDSSLFTATPELFAYGMVSALLAASIWLHIASTTGWPVSTTHSIVGGIAGFGLVAGGFSAIAWGKMAQIVISWVLSPLLGGIIAAAMFIFISRRIIDTENPHLQLKKVTPYLIFLVISILFLSIIYKGLKNLHLDLPFNQALFFASLIGLFAAVISKVLIDKVEPGYKGGFDAVERVFRYLQILTACYVAFAHGANDVANSIGPVAAVISIIQTKAVQMKVEVPIWLLFIGGSGIVFGLATYGYKVIEMVGKKITEITPTRGFSAEFGAATTVLVASKLGLPVSTTHTLVGSVIGVGLARGMAALNLRVIRDIFISWGATIPFTAILTVLFYKVLSALLT